MTDLQKLRYNLAMNCALVETSQQFRLNNDLDLQTAMVENFQKSYEKYCTAKADEKLLSALKAIPAGEQRIFNEVNRLVPAGK